MSLVKTYLLKNFRYAVKWRKCINHYTSPINSKSIYQNTFRVGSIRAKFFHLFNLLAKRSILGMVANVSVICTKYFCHSVLSAHSLDSRSASTFRIPGMCAEVNQIFRVSAQSQISCVTPSILMDFSLPILFILDTADVLSTFSKI